MSNCNRILFPYGAPLPRLNPEHPDVGGGDRYEVVIVGAGPAGFTLELLLARHGLGDHSLLCIDAKSSRVRCGQADGIQPRTLEVLKSMGLVDQILQDGCHLWDLAIWKPSHDRSIERFSVSRNIVVPARYEQTVTINQGIIEQIFEDDLSRYSQRGVQRDSKLVDVTIDELGDPDFPIIASIETNGVPRTVRAKFLVGADGAHSTVRKSLGIPLIGESVDDYWGVIDFVADTDFPDIRRFGRIRSHNGTVMVIPREYTVNGEYLTRLYVQMPILDTVEANSLPLPSNSPRSSSRGGSRKHQIALDDIFCQISKIFEPYYIKPKFSGVVNWWTVYQIGQRIAERFTVKDSKGMSRVFLIGDSCHTHSPKAGQGMNVSMMDAHNLSWKLAYTVQGLSPNHTESSSTTDLLETYETERHPIAQKLINFDKEYSAAFIERVKAGEGQEAAAISHRHLELYEESLAFASGCGVEYCENDLVIKTFPIAYKDPIKGEDYFQGILRPGRRLLNVKVKRFADGFPRDLQDEFLSNGRFRILCLTSTDLLTPDGVSAKAVSAISQSVLPTFPASIIELVVMYPRLSRDFTWNCIPKDLKRTSEMRFFCGYDPQDAYKTYGVDPEQGVVAVVRPDGHIGIISRIDDVQRLIEYLERCIRKL